LVETGGEFDLKNKEEGQYSHDDFSATMTEFMYYDGRLWSSEQLGNFTFGYFGASYGYSEEFLCFGAGIYQIVSGTSRREWMSTYWDDPSDGALIRMGWQNHANK